LIARLRVSVPAMRGSHVITVLMMIAGCGFNPSGGQPADDVVDPDGGGPDDDGSPGDGACVEGCDGFDVVTCTGGQETRTPCSAGCLDAGGPHCATLIPSNGANASDLVDVTGDLVVNAGQIVVADTDDGSIVVYSGGSGSPTTIRDPGNGLGDMIRYRTLSQTGGAPALAIFGVRRITIADGGRLRVIGDRSVVFLVATEAAISGVVDVAAGHMGDTGSVDCQECSGPGGGAGGTSLTAASGCAPGINGQYSATLDETGGGGGGLGTMGARGGDSDSGTSLGGDVTALTACSGASLVPLQGGSGGGRSSGTVTFGNEVGGGGGGAVQITALDNIAITTTGEIYAAGAGGDGSADDYGGGGGGAGGGILLESPTITIVGAARITANGGGGGSGREANRGENGSRAAVRASGGAGDGTGGNDGRGGLGSIGAGATQVATQGGGSVDGTGGGGGGAGIIRINVVAPLLLPGSVILSPVPSMGQPQRQ
jgi:hypothetical protein